MSDVLNSFNDKSTLVYATPPLFCNFEKGCYSFFIDKKQFTNCLKDATIDRFSPWTGDQVNGSGVKTRVRTCFQKQTVKCCGDNFISDLEGELEFRLYSNVHPNFPGISRKVAYVVDQNEQLYSNVYYSYSSEENVSCSTLTFSSLSRKRKKPSEYSEIKEALANRTLAEAKKVLISKGINVTSQELSSLSRSVPSHVKSRCGRKPPTSTTKLIDRFAAGLNKAEFLKPVEVTKTGDKVCIVQLVAYPVAVAHYVKVLPYLEDLHEHMKNLEVFRSLSPYEAELEFGKYILSSNASGSLPLFGNSIFIDTTFSLVSGEYVTLAVAITDQFKTTSGKNSSFLLAAMIHTEKTIEVHEKFSSFLNELIAHENMDKRVPSIIHDGESSFRVYQTGLILKDAVVLRCDIHRCENIKRLFKKDVESFKKFKTSVFGQKKMTSNGVVLKGGLLGVLSYNEFDRKLKNLIQGTEVLEAKNWLIQNADSLFHTASLIKKLEGGWPCQQFLTTNVIEGRNAYLKNVITSPIPADSALDELLRIHEDEMRQRKKAIVGERSTLMTEFTYSNFHTMSKDQQTKVLRDFGLDKNFLSNVYENFPSWLSTGDGKLHKDVFLKLLDKIVVYPSGKTYFTETDNFISKVVLEHKRLFCFNPLCKKHRDHTYYVCIHMLSVFHELESEERKDFVEAMELHRSQRTFEQVRFKTQSALDGTKYTARKGLQFSKNNHSRAFHVLSRLSLDSSTANESSFLEDDNDDDDEEDLNFS